MRSAFSTVSRRVYQRRERNFPSVDQVAMFCVAAALSVQLLDAMLQPTYDSQDSTTALFASDDASHKLIVDALRLAHSIQHEASSAASRQSHVHDSGRRMSDEDIVSAAVSKLNKTGVLVIPGVFTGLALQSCRDQAAVLMLPGSDGVIVARPGSGSDEAIDREVFFKWVRPDNSQIEEKDRPIAQKNNPSRGGLQSAIALIRSVPFFLEGSSSDYERSSGHEVPNLCRLASMPGTGATYRPHRDATIYSVSELGLVGWLKARGYQRRVLTCILYLNEEQWSDHENVSLVGKKHDKREKGNGGCLRLHPNADPSDRVGESSSGTHVDVSPNGGTLVVFDAKDVLHEVLPTFCDRLTITSWVVGDHRS